MKKEWLNIKEMGEYLGVSYTKAKELAHREGFPIYWLDKKTPKINVNELDEWVKSKRLA